MKTSWHMLAVGGLYSNGSFRACFRPINLPKSSWVKGHSLSKAILILLLAQLLNGCDRSGPAAPKFSQAPQLIITDTSVPLVTIVAFETDQPVLATYKISDGQSSWQAHSRITTAEAKTNSYRKIHRDALLKFKPDTLHRIHVRITNAAGQSTELAKPLLFRTPALPESFPQIQVDAATNNAAQDDIALINVINSQSDHRSADGEPVGWLIGIDSAGTVVWFMPTDAPWHKFQQLESGNLRLYNQSGSALEVDMLGNKLGAWLKNPKQPTSKHSAAKAYFKRHGISPKTLLMASPSISMPNGHHLALNDGLISEFNSRENVLQQCHITDNLGAQFNTTDASGIAYRAHTDNIILTLYKQQALAAIDRTNGQLQWLLGDATNPQWSSGQSPDKWLKPQANTQTDNLVWLEGPRQTYISAQGNLIFFDQHKNTDSQIRVYSIDKTNMTFKQLGQYEVGKAQLPAPMHYFAPTTSGATNAKTNSANQSLLLSYRQSAHSSRLIRLPLANILKAPQKHMQESEIYLQLNGGLIHDNKLVARLIPPEITQLTDKQIPIAPAKNQQAASKSPNQAPNTKAQEMSQTTMETPVIEGGWQIVIDTPQGRSEQLLKIDKQQGPIGLGYLKDYPVMAVIKGSSLKFTARTTGTKGTATWRYQGTIHASGLEAEGLLTLRDPQGEILASDIPWQAYRQ